MIKILVVDDEVDIQSLFVQAFRRKIYNKEWDFVFSENGKEALKLLKNSPDIDLVLSDINMPEMDGLTLLSEIKNSEINVRTVIISAYGDMKNIRTAMNRGAFDFITKPMDFDDVRTTIEKTIEHIKVLKQALKAQNNLLSFQKELEVAQSIQESILPVSTRLSSRCDMVTKMIPARMVGGDFYDFFLIDDRHMGLTVADVSGKGVSSALFAVVCQTLLKSLGTRTKAPTPCVESVNQICSQNNTNCMFMTLFYGVLNLQTGEFHYINAGHTVPYHISRGGKVDTLPAFSNIPLGIKPKASFKEESLTLQPGDKICLYTDGITEAQNQSREFFGDFRLVKALTQTARSSLKNMGDEILKSVQEFSKNTPQSDDITYVLFQYNG